MQFSFGSASRGDSLTSAITSLLMKIAITRNKKEHILPKMRIWFHKLDFIMLMENILVWKQLLMKMHMPNGLPLLNPGIETFY